MINFIAFFTLGMISWNYDVILGIDIFDFAKFLVGIPVSFIVAAVMTLMIR